LAAITLTSSEFRDGTHGLVIADVSGHGVSAGILMSSLQTALRTMATDADSPAEILDGSIASISTTLTLQLS
jgi:serine phosphatase RsbU (regulator of sigma subunit)